MSMAVPARVGDDGVVAIPASIWLQAGIAGESGIVVEARDQEIVIRAAMPSIEEYTAERKAEFLLNNAVSEKDYEQARTEVVKLGLNPDQVSHVRPHTAEA